MAKKRTSRKKSFSGTRSKGLNINPLGMVNEAKKPALMLLGMFAGAKVLSMIDQNVSPQVQGLMGLDGNGRKLVAPLVTTVAGLVVSQMQSNPDIKMVGYGVAATGGAYLVRNMLKFEVLPLKGLEGVGQVENENGLVSIPGFGSASQQQLPMPGFGDTLSPADLQLPELTGMQMSDLSGETFEEAQESIAVL